MQTDPQSSTSTPPHSSADLSGRVRFGAFEMDLDTEELWRSGRRVGLGPKPGRALALLVRRGGQLVRRQTFYDHLWADTVVELEQGLNTVIRQLRSALGDDAVRPRYIETVPRKGYRLICPVQKPAPATTVFHGRTGWSLGAAAAAAIVLTVAWVQGGSTAAGGSAGGETLGQAAAPTTVAATPAAAGILAGAGLPDRFRRLAVAGRHLVTRETSSDAARALPMLREVLERFPRHPQTLTDYSMALARTGRMEEAWSAVDAALDAAPKHGAAWEMKGTLLLREWRVGEAREALERAVRLSPTVARHHHSLAYARALEADHEGARESMDIARALDPIEPAVWGDSGLFAFWAGRYAESLDQCRFSLGLVDPRFRLRPVRCLLRAHAAMGEWDLAGEQARELLVSAGLSTERANRLLGSEARLGAYWRWAARPENLVHSQGGEGPFAAAVAAAEAGQLDRAVDALNTAAAQRTPQLVQVKVAPQFAGLRDHPDLQRIARLITEAGGLRPATGAAGHSIESRDTP